MSQPIDFSPVKKARLGATDLSRLCKVSRVTASLWLNDDRNPSHLLTERVQSVVDDVRRALQANLLPVPHHVMRRERGLYIRQAIEQARSAR